MSSHDPYIEEIKTLWREVNGLKQRINDLMTEEHLTGAVGSVTSVNGDTGVVVLDSNDIAEGATNLYFTAAEETKLAGIETAADVTDAGNVTAAGAVMSTGDLSVAGLKIFTALLTASGGFLSPTIDGSIAANGDITIQGTTHATRTTSYVLLQPTAGNVGIGSTAPAQLLVLNAALPIIEFDISNVAKAYMGVASGASAIIANSATGDIVIRGNSQQILFSTDSGTTAHAMLSAGNLLVGYTTSNGAYKLQVNSQIFATSATIATSDRRAKKNIKSLASGLDAINALRPVTYNFKKSDVHNFPQGKQLGFIAQEVEAALADKEYLPCLVPPLEDEENQLRGMAETKIVPILVKAVQELSAQVGALGAQVATLSRARG